MSPSDKQPSPSSSFKSDDARALPVSSSQLLKQTRELLIDHGGEIYRLRITRSGKLILTK